MFGSDEKRREEGLKQITDNWMSVCALIVDKDDVKRNDEKLKIFVAYFYGTTKLLGRNSGVSEMITMAIFIFCIQRQLNLTRSDRTCALDALGAVIANDGKYATITQTGIEAFDEWLKTKGRVAPVALIGVLGGR